MSENFTINTSRLDDMVYQCEAYIDRDAKVGKNVTMGVHCIIEAGVEIGDNCFIGHFSHIRTGSVIGKNSQVRSWSFIDPEVVIGNYVKIFPYCCISAGSVLEDQVYIGIHSTLINFQSFNWQRDKKEIAKPMAPRIKRGAVIAAHCKIGPGVVVGENSLLGMASLLTKSIPDGEKWYGHPAKFRGYVGEKDKAIWPYSVDSEVLK